MKILNKILTSGTLLGVIAMMSSCSGDEDGAGCDSSNAITITTMVENADCGVSNGVITVNAAGGDGQYQYSLDQGSFANSNTISGVSVGEHEVTVRDGAQCSTTIAVSVTSGISFANNIAPIIATNCAIPTCHVAGTSRVDLTVLNAVQFNAEDIKSRVESGNMPRNGVLAPAEITAIACWVDDGALDN